MLSNIQLSTIPMSFQITGIIKMIKKVVECLTDLVYLVSCGPFTNLTHDTGQTCVRLMKLKISITYYFVYPFK